MNLVDQQAMQLCAGLTGAQLSWRPLSGKWSIAENLAHLRTTTQVFLPVADAALEQCRQLKFHRPGPFRLGVYGSWLVWRMGEGPMVKLRAPLVIQPQVMESPDQELEHFLASQNAMRQRMEGAKDLDLTAQRFASPLVKYLRVNLLEFFSVFNAHSRRHLWQANNVRKALPGQL